MKDDTISRQAALEAMDTWDKFGCAPDGKLVRYDDDKHYVPYVHYEDMVHVIKALPSAQPGWVTCKERLPEKDGEYLTTTEDGLYDVEYYGDGEWYYDDVVAWMPFPEWKGEDDD